MSSHFLEPLQQFIVNSFRAELDDELIVINRGLFAILIHGTLYVPGCDDLVVNIGL